MTEARTVLDVEQEIIEAEAAIARGLFLRRIARTWLFGVTPIIIGGSVAGNIFIDLSKPGDGRFGLNVASVRICLFSTILASMSWWDCRIVIDQSQVDLSKLNAQKTHFFQRSTILSTIPSVIT
ncbi:hypothetical protein [Streptomyces sp. NPDC056670]|uniref:hypothetical protein n=1 Tax=Streptomyces sp. NPDC056670 TaxID=3345904 RepID=UPI0036833D24